MDKKPISIGFVDFIPALESFFTTILSEYYTIEKDNKDPDFLFFSTEDFGTDNKKFDNTGSIKILFTGENRRPKDYTCNYAISFDHMVDPWHYRLPLYVVDMWAIPAFAGHTQYPFSHITSLYNQSEQNKQETIVRDMFCGFVHRNPHNEIRNLAFHKLSEYKPVISGGPVLNNMGSLVHGIDGKIDLFKRCKFALCFENSANPGYVTEKILHAFYAGAIPVYWGSHTIGRDFNTESFINAGAFRSMDDLLDHIKEIDTNDNLYNYMLDQPKVTYNLPNDCMMMDKFLNWFDAVVFNKRHMRIINKDMVTIKII